MLIPFRDHADKGDLRLDYQQSANTRYFLRVSDRKETGINFPTIPLPLESQTAGHIDSRPADRARLHGHFRRQPDSSICAWASPGPGPASTPLSQGTALLSMCADPRPADHANVPGGLPSVAISGGFTSFGRQSTNPQCQNPSLLDPKVNFTWVKGNHSLKFGYEYEKIWMGVLDNNPLYGSFTYGGGYSACPAVHPFRAAATALPQPERPELSQPKSPTPTSRTSSSAQPALTLWPTTSRPICGRHLDSAYAQDDWKVTAQADLEPRPPLGVRLALVGAAQQHLQLGSGLANGLHAQLPVRPRATASPLLPERRLRQNARQSRPERLCAPRRLRYAPIAKISIRGGFGTSYVHYTRAGSGDISPSTPRMRSLPP